MLVILAAHGVRLVAFHLGEFLAGFLEAKAKMAGETLNVTLLEGNHGIGTAIARTFRTIIDGHDFDPVSVRLCPYSAPGAAAKSFL
jgi:hypothetical protein